MSRWKAASIHLGISAGVVFLLGMLLAATWYPPAYAWAVGGLALIGILAAVDVFIGPLLTLIVFDVRKSSLKFDLAAIALIQVLALSYGLYSIFLARPVYLVFTVDRFDLVTAAAIPAGELANAEREEFRSLPLTGPEIVAVQMPTDANEQKAVLFSAVRSGLDYQHLPKYYVPYREMAAEALRKALPVTQLIERDPEAQRTLSAFLKSEKLEPSQVKFLPLRAKKHDETVVLDGQSGDIVGVVDVWPWEPT